MPLPVEDDVPEMAIEEETPPDEEVSALLAKMAEERKASAAEAEAAIPPGTFIIAVRQRTKVKTLHQFTSCFRIPGKDYIDYVVHGPEVPDATLYHNACGDCFRKRRPQKRIEEISDASTGSSSSSDEEWPEQPDAEQ